MLFLRTGKRVGKLQGEKRAVQSEEEAKNSLPLLNQSRRLKLSPTVHRHCTRAMKGKISHLN